MVSLQKIVQVWAETETYRLNHLQLFWEHSPFWLIPIFIGCLGTAFLFYPPGNHWDKSTRWVLLSLRSLFLFFLVSLLLNPLIRRFRQSLLPPVTVVVVDDSQSVGLGSNGDSLTVFQSNLRKLVKSLTDAGSEIHLLGLEGNLSTDSTLRFGQRKTNLEATVKKIEEEYDNENITSVILASDGIVNQGSDPAQLPHTVPFHTVLLGNPDVRKDLSISQVLHNKVAFQGNTFPIRVQVKSSRLPGVTATITLSDEQKTLETKVVKTSEGGLGEVEFQVKAQGKGLKSFRVEVKPIEGELTLLNNSRKVYVEVIDGKQKILLAASSPHPDIKAIRRALEGLDHLEVTTVVGGLDSWKVGVYDLVILHQLPDRYGTYSQQISGLLKGNIPTLQICGSVTDFNRLRLEASAWLNIQGFGNGMEEMSGQFNSDFQRFAYEENWKSTLEGLPPLLSPVASFSFKTPYEVILKQKLGKALTNTPLLAVASTSQPRRGIFWGEGLWLWRLNEYAQSQKFESVDNLIQKTVQYLVASDKKQRLKCYLAQNELFEGEPARFQVETYNPLFEPIYNQKINLELVRNDGKRFQYSFFNSQSSNSFSTENLPEGTYQFKASATLNGKPETDAGEFQVKANQLELQDLQANHNALIQLATQTGGKAVHIGSMQNLVPDKENLPKPLVEFTDWDESILNQYWVLILLVALATAEWTIRKWNGTL